MLNILHIIDHARLLAVSVSMVVYYVKQKDVYFEISENFQVFLQYHLIIFIFHIFYLYSPFFYLRC